MWNRKWTVLCRGPLSFIVFQRSIFIQSVTSEFARQKRERERERGGLDRSILQALLQGQDVEHAGHTTDATDARF